MRARIYGLPLAALSATGLTACMVCLYSGVRHVMQTQGGFCASGGPYVIANQCSGGDVRLVLVGFLGGLLCALVLAAATAWLQGPVLGSALLMWSALFGSLGWNFIYFAMNPPKGQSGTGGWVATGVVFWLMALGGLIPVLVMAANWLRRGGNPEPPPSTSTEPLVRAAVPAGFRQTNPWNSP